MATPSNPTPVKTVHKNFEGGQVPPTGSTVPPKLMHEDPPRGIIAPRKSQQATSLHNSVPHTKKKLY